LFKWSPERIVSIVCIIGIIILGAVCIELEYNIFGTSPNQYSILLDDKLIYNNAKSTDKTKYHLVIGNNGSSLKTLDFYQSGNVTPNAALFTSMLSTNSGKTISHLTFDNMPNITIKNESTPTKIYEVGAPGFSSGSYEGYLYLKSSSNLTVIPIKVITQPKILESTLIAVIGILLGFLIWEVIVYVVAWLSQIGATSIRKSIQNFQPSPNEDGSNNHLSQESIVQLESLRTRMYSLENRTVWLKNRYYVKPLSIVGTEVAAVVFAIFISITNLLNNASVINVIEMTPLDVAKLLIIGIGIANLKAISELKGSRGM